MDVRRRQSGTNAPTMEDEPMDNGNRPATKDDLALLRSELKQDVALLRSELKQDIAILRSETQHMYDDLKESLRDNQTELLKAFYSVQQSTDTRMRMLEGQDAGLVLRMSHLESRMLLVEKRLDLPPAQ